MSRKGHHVYEAKIRHEKHICWKMVKDKTKYICKAIRTVDKYKFSIRLADITKMPEHTDNIKV